MRALLLVTLLGLAAACRADDIGIWRASASSDYGRIVVSNGTGTAGTAISCQWKALRDGGVVAMGAFRVAHLKPGRAATNQVPAIVRDLRRKEGAVSLRIVFSRLEENADGDPVKVILRSDQVDFPNGVAATLPGGVGGPLPTTSGDEISFRANGFVCTFDRRTGLLKQMASEGFLGRTWLAAPLAPAGAYEPERLRLSPPENRLEGTVFTTVVRWHAAAASDDLDAVTRWTFRNDGILHHVCEIRPVDPDATLRDGIGLRLALAAEEPVLQYFGKGRGPKEPAASDEMLGQWTLRLPDSPASGSRADVRAVAVDPGAKHLSVVTTEKPFDFDYKLGKTTELVIRPQGVTTDGVARLAFALWPAKRLSAAAVPPPVLPPPAPRGVSASGTLPFAKFHELPGEVTAKGLLVRMDAEAKGRVKGFTFEASEDGKLWTRVFEGELADRTGWQEANFKVPAKMRWWRFEAVNGHAGAKEASVAEIKVTE